MRLPQDEEEAIRVIRRSFELGVNYLDTALVYGESERICGKALKGWRDKVYVSTKNPLHDETVDGWWSRLNHSLESLDIDYIDFYHVVHNMRWYDYENFYTKAHVTYGFESTNLSATSAELFASEPIMRRICSEGAASLPPPTGPITTTAIPRSWAYAMASAFLRSSRLYWTVIPSNSPVSMSRIMFSGVSWQEKKT